MVFSEIARWMNSKGYVQGVCWAIATCFISASNDVLMRLMGSRLHGLEVAFFRFFFSFIIVIPFIVYRSGFTIPRIHQPYLHLLRAILGVAAITTCCYAVVLLPLSQVTTIFFTQPLFVLALASFFLAERVGQKRWIATLLGFLGIVITTFHTGEETLNIVIFIPIIGALLFAWQDILIKKMVKQENPLTMLFYFSTISTVVSFLPLIWVWQMPTESEIFFLLLLGLGANLIQLTLFKAFSATTVSSLAPFRYVELIFSISFGVIIFSEIPFPSTLLGAAVIIPATLYVVYAEIQERRLLQTQA